ncbi:MAG: YceK/YidQ family lipoprotein [Planctomycetes bacterium]|nr:YceK/YidQ family lipoprotein [Planctomycetota bacterium]
MKKWLTTLLLPVSLLLVPGCATLVARADPEPGDPRYLYPAVEMDLKGLYDCRPWRPAQEMHCMWELILPFFAPFLICDLPISLAADTICLPYDLYMVTLAGKSRTVEPKTPPQPAADSGSAPR